MTKRIFISITIGLFTLLLAGIILELVKTDKQKADRYFRTRNVFQYDANNIAFDPVLGYRLAPFLNTAFNNEEFSTTVRTNALGYRDDGASISSPDVLFLGDSYVFGWGVDENDDVEKQYEQLTGKKVLNMGVPGYGNIQELLTLYKWEKTAPPFNKHIYLFFSANDLIDNENTSFGLFPSFMQTASGFNFTRPLPDGYRQWLQTTNSWMIHNDLAKKSMLVYYSCSAVKNLFTKNIYKDYQQDSPQKLDGSKAFVLVAENLASFQQQYRCPITIVYIAPAAYYKSGLPDVSYKLVRAICKKTGLDFADLSPILNEDDYYPLDKHWNITGHKKAAAFLSKLHL